MKNLCVLLITVFIAIPAMSVAGVIHVPCDEPTIQAGVDAAAPGDTVLVASGSYVEHDILVTSGVWIIGETGDPSSVIVSAMDQGRVFHFYDTEGECGVRGLTMTHGYDDMFGGGVRIFVSTVTFEDCLFVSNASDGAGAGVSLNGGAAVFTNCDFVGNSANTDAGAFYGLYSSVICSGCTFEGNYGGWGGCIHWSCGNDLLLEDCTFRGNSAVKKGVLSVQGTACEVTVRGCLFERNRAEEFAGAVFCRYAKSVLIDECVFLGNESDEAASAIDVLLQSSFTLSNCTIVGGAGSHPTEAVRMRGESEIVAENCIIAFTSPGCAVNCEPEGSIEFVCSDIFGNADGDWTGCIADQLGVNGNITADPMFCDLAYDDLSLDAGSPCAPAYSPCGELVGALGVGCQTTPVAEVTWGRIKALYR